MGKASILVFPLCQQWHQGLWGYRLVVPACYKLQKPRPPGIEDVRTTVEIFGSKLVVRGMGSVLAQKWHESSADDISLQRNRLGLESVHCQS
jgi:hypothetical protein